MRRAAALLAVLALIAGGALLGRATARRQAPGWPVPDFSLTDDHGRVVRRADLLGRPWVAAFIYASCGTQCPMMTARMAALHKRLPGAALVSFSVDETDTPRRLATFKAANHADWMFLTGGKGAVQALAKDGFKLPAAPGAEPGASIVHSDRLALVDAQGSVRGFYDPSDAGQLDALAGLLRALGAGRSL